MGDLQIQQPPQDPFAKLPPKEKEKVSEQGLELNSDGILTTGPKSTSDVKSAQKITEDKIEQAQGNPALSKEFSIGKNAPNDPKLFPPGTFNAEQVLTSLKSNAWFTSSFLVTLTMNLMEIVKLNKKIKTAEASMTINMMDATINLAKMIGQLIMEKAELEKEKHLKNALMAGIGMGVAVLGAGISITGSFVSMGGLAKKYKAETMEPGVDLPGSEVTAQGSPNGPKKTELSPEQLKEQKKLNYEGEMQERKGSIVSTVGTTLSHSIGTSLDKMLSSINESNYVDIIAAKERDIELLRALMQNARTALDSASKGFSDSGQMVDAAMQMLQKIQDAVNEAHKIKIG